MANKYTFTKLAPFRMVGIQFSLVLNWKGNNRRHFLNSYNGGMGRVDKIRLEKIKKCLLS